MKKSRKLLMIFAASLLLVGCNNKTETQNEEQQQDQQQEQKEDDALSDEPSARSDNNNSDYTQNEDPYGTNCSADRTCPDGYACVPNNDFSNWLCKESCGSSDDCHNDCRYCSPGTGTCEPYPAGEKTDACNGTNQQCNGEGFCQCIGNFGGEECYTCKTGWAGQNCDRCAEGYFGADCQPVTCKNGVANEGLDGDGHCSSCINEHFTGTDCDQCLTGFTGTNCDQCAENRYGQSCAVYGSVTDQDGNTYKTIIMGDQEWMAENYRRETGTYYYPNNDSNNKTTYGLLYDWDTAASSNFCPSGWHLPHYEELSSVIEYSEEYGSSALEHLLLSLLAKSTAWVNYSNQGLDDFGFAALPAGIYDSEAKSYNGFGYETIFWSSDEYELHGTYYGHTLYLGEDVGNMLVVMEYADKSVGLSVRCLKDSN